jgi:hypothetical protein
MVSISETCCESENNINLFNLNGKFVDGAYNKYFTYIMIKKNMLLVCSYNFSWDPEEKSSTSYTTKT